MTESHRRHHVLHLGAREPLPETQPAAPDGEVNGLLLRLPEILRRTPTGSSSSSTSTSTCSPSSSSSKCQTSSGPSGTTIAIIVGVVGPVVLILIIAYILHRRHVRILRTEDVNDRHKSLDFGIDPTIPMASRKGRKGGATEMVTDVESEKALRRGRGLSMDMGSPYVLPPGLQGSRESLHSLSRTNHTWHDPYRPATTFTPSDASMRSYPNSRHGADDSSSYTGSSGRGQGQETMNQNLLRNAQRMSRSLPPQSSQLSSPTSTPAIPEVQSQDSSPTVARKGLPSSPRLPNNGPNLVQPASRDANNQGDLRLSDNYLGPLINSREPSRDLLTGSPPQQESSPPQGLPQRPSKRNPTLPTINVSAPSSRPERKQSLPANDNRNENAVKVTPPSPPQAVRSQHEGTTKEVHMPNSNDYVNASGNLDTTGLGYDVRRLSMGFRPLPPEDPSDNPEQRANRIRSFYKEYFDESKPGPAYGPEDYYEDYDQGYLHEGAIFDPATGQFIVAKAPFAEPVTRRAMTPPPRAPPRFRGRGHQATSSNPSLMSPGGPRAFSSASGRFGPPKKVLPPPNPLRTLPTPYQLREDAFALPIDFAPPSSFRTRTAGRPESPTSVSRPYSPMVPAFSPLVSSFDDLSVMPSPHQLRKSGLFTALDFAPPPRFKNSDSGSDAGSIRSGRSGASGISAAQVHSIRAGAYRLSRVPKEVVGTKNEFANSLKPSWDMRV